MTIWILIFLIALAWLLYPVFGALGVASEIAEGDRPEDAGFSFLPELIVFPPTFFGLAMLIDYFVKPWGKWIIGTLCIAMLVLGVVTSIRNIRVIHRNRIAKRKPE